MSSVHGTFLDPPFSLLGHGLADLWTLPFYLKVHSSEIRLVPKIDGDLLITSRLCSVKLKNLTRYRAARGPGATLL